MTTTVITPPAPLLTPAEARALAPALAAESDARLTLLLATAQMGLEPPFTTVGRAFGVQTLESSFDGFGRSPRHPFVIPFPPLRQVLSVTYEDRLGAMQTLDPSAYRVRPLSGCGTLFPSEGIWPSPAECLDAVIVRYEAGYDPGAPELTRAKFALVLAVQDMRLVADEDLFARSETVEGVGSVTRAPSPQAQQILCTTADRLLAPLRVFL